MPPVAEAQLPKPVSVVVLQQVSGSRSRLYSGTIEPWNRESPGFEVAGRIVRVVAVGTQVTGPVRDADGNVVEPGTELAVLAADRYQLQLEAAQAEQLALRRKIDALTIDIDEVQQAQLSAAEAQRDSATGDAKRVDRAFEAGAVTASQRDLARTGQRTAIAAVQQAESGIRARSAERQATEAQLEALNVAVRKAQRDIDDCVLHAPFSGQVAQVHAVNGGVVAAGQPVVTLVMMDPLKVEVAVSSSADRQLGIGDTVRIEAGGYDSDVSVSDTIREQTEQDHTKRDAAAADIGWIHDKSTVADPATRTFALSVLVRNQQVSTTTRADTPSGNDPQLPRINEFTALQPLDPANPVQLFVAAQSLFGNDVDGFSVWKIDGLQRDDLRGLFAPQRQLLRVPVTLGSQRIDLPGSIVMRELADAGGVSTDDVLAVGVPNGFAAGDEVLVVRERWKYRPGEMVGVRIGPGDSQPGYFVPLAAIIEDDGQHFVYRVDDQDRAARLSVRIGDNVGGLQRIEADELTDGVTIVVRGAHMLDPDGEPVVVIAEESTSGVEGQR